MMGLDTTLLEIVIAGDDKMLSHTAGVILPVREEGNLLLYTFLLENVAGNTLSDIANGTIGSLTSNGMIVIFGEIMRRVSMHPVQQRGGQISFRPSTQQLLHRGSLPLQPPSITYDLHHVGHRTPPPLPHQGYQADVPRLPGSPVREERTFRPLHTIARGESCRGSQSGSFQVRC